MKKAIAKIKILIIERNGYSKKTVKSQFGNIELDIPRDRNSECDPKVIPKHIKNISGLEEKIISLYARGMSTREIQDEIKDLYGIEISAKYVSHITDAVIEQSRLWQSRPIEPIYPFIFMDAIHYKVKEDSKELMKDFKSVYKAINESEALSALDVVEEKWGKNILQQ